jgi:hypothetical protein
VPRVSAVQPLHRGRRDVAYLELLTHDERIVAYVLATVVELADIEATLRALGLATGAFVGRALRSAEYPQARHDQHSSDFPDTGGSDGPASFRW